MEKGIRIFFKEGDFDNFDPIEEHEYGFDGEVFWVNNGNRYEWAKDSVARIVSYEITQEKADNGCYVRIFDDASAIRYTSDIERTEP